MSGYSQPDFETLAAELKRAGADENGQIAGAYWISSALLGLGHKKTPTEDVERLKRAAKHLQDAKTLIAECDPWFHKGGGMDELVTQRIDKAAQFLKWVTTNYPGGHREPPAHARFIDALRRFFISEGLPITLSDESPFVTILGHCIGQDGGNARQAIIRIYGSDFSKETDDEKSLQPLRAAEKEAYAASVCRLNEWRKE